MIGWLAQLEDADRQRVITEAFGKVAATPEGQVVFEVLFEIGGLFEPVQGEDTRGRHNLMVELLQWFPDAEVRMLSALLHIRTENGS